MEIIEMVITKIVTYDALAYFQAIAPLLTAAVAAWALFRNTREVTSNALRVAEIAARQAYETATASVELKAKLDRDADSAVVIAMVATEISMLCDLFDAAKILETHVNVTRDARARGEFRINTAESDRTLHQMWDTYVSKIGLMGTFAPDVVRFYKLIELADGEQMDMLKIAKLHPGWPNFPLDTRSDEFKMRVWASQDRQIAYLTEALLVGK
ncbi:MAG: hypothetical protein EOP06_30445, partial [Proteobacteria bacterium]